MCAAAILPKSADVSIDYVWIGMQEDPDGSFGPWTWSDGTPMDYMNHNDILDRKEDLCGLIHSDGDGLVLGEWDDGECDGEDVYGYLCKDID